MHIASLNHCPHAESTADSAEQLKRLKKLLKTESTTSLFRQTAHFSWKKGGDLSVAHSVESVSKCNSFYEEKSVALTQHIEENILRRMRWENE